MFSETVTGSIEGSMRGSLVGRTLVSHNNTSTTNSSSRRPDSSVGLGLSGLISNLGYSTVNCDDSMSGRNSGNGSPRDENVGMRREGGKKPMAAKTSVFSILPDDEDDDGEELEMI